jgi:hypothetical protein
MASPAACKLSAPLSSDAPTTDEVALIEQFYKDGGKLHTKGAVDRSQFKRLEDLGWLSGHAVNLNEVVYAITETGSNVAALD